MEKSTTSKDVFRKHYPYEEAAKMLSTIDVDSPSSNCSIKTFSCESDIHPTNSFDCQKYFAVDTENMTIETRSQDERKIGLVESQICDIQSAIVTPPKPYASMVEIFLDPLSQSQLHPFLSDEGVNNQKAMAKKQLGLLFPTADPSYSTTAIPKYNASLLHESGYQNDDHPVDATTMNTDSIFRRLHESCVYKRLKPSLPLPGSFGPILCFLLHMEFSSAIDSAVVHQACQVVNDHIKDGIYEICNNEGIIKKWIQHISGDIVDKLVETLGSRVDLPDLFQASARTYSHLVDAEDERLSLFLRDDLKESEQKKNKLKITEDEVISQSSFQKLANCTGTAGRKRKDRPNVDLDDKETTSKKQKEFIPTILQLAIAYGAEQFGKLEYNQTSLEKFVKKTSSQLQCMNPMERKEEWSALVEVWDDHARRS